MIKVVLWDLDGTILDTTDLILASYKHAFEKVFGRLIDDKEALANFGRTLKDVMFTYSKEKGEELIEAYRDFNHKRHDGMIRPYPGILDALANVKRRGFGQAVVTSKTEWLAKRGLELFGLQGHIDDIIGFESTNLHKPNPDPILEALKRLKIEPEEAIFVGDSAADEGCAKAAGVPFVSALWGPNPEFAAAADSWQKIVDPRDILHLIQKRGPRI